MGSFNTSKIKNKIPTGPFTINGEKYSREKLLEFCWAKTIAAEISPWERDVYLFISDFLEGKVDLIQKTSGTTGDPKSFVLNRNAMIQSAWNTIHYFDLQPGNRILLCLPVRYIAGRMMVVRALVGGLDLRVVEPSSIPDLDVELYYDFAAMVPLQAFKLLASGKSINVKKLIIGGGEVSQELRDMLNEQRNCQVYETFGMSETYTHFAARLVNGPVPQEDFNVLSGVKMITDNRGCLLVNVEGVTKGVVQTNDLVEIEGGTSFRWLGRLDNVINSGGIKIIPEILEKEIKNITRKESVLIPLPDAKLGQKMVLVLEGSKDQRKEDYWHTRFQEVFQKHEVPKQIFYVDEFPRNASMKVSRQELRSLLSH